MILTISFCGVYTTCWTGLAELLQLLHTQASVHKRLHLRLSQPVEQPQQSNFNSVWGAAGWVFQVNGMAPSCIFHPCWGRLGTMPGERQCFHRYAWKLLRDVLNECIVYWWKIKMRLWWRAENIDFVYSLFAVHLTHKFLAESKQSIQWVQAPPSCCMASP